jgi:predicted enzyme related to lactoylglutathione lyase
MVGCMPTRLVHMVLDANDPARLAAFWAAALGWEADLDDLPDEAAVLPAGFSYPGTSAVPLVLIPVPERKTGKNRIHLDLASHSVAGQQELVARLRELGATPVDIGQGDVPWVVLADPEGNEFCVLEPRPEYADTGPVAAIVVDSADPDRQAKFWTAVSGWQRVHADDGLVGLRSPDQAGPYLELLQSADRKTAKYRLHLDVAPHLGEDQAAAVDAAVTAGASRADIGQGEVTWTVLADPEGGEFCVLSPR